VAPITTKLTRMYRIETTAQEVISPTFRSRSGFFVSSPAWTWISEPSKAI
jgi:hypothetical protein